MSNNNNYQHTRIREADGERPPVSNSDNYSHTRVEGGRRDGPPTSSAPPASTSFETYSNFVPYISQRRCPQCDTALIESSRQVESFFRSWLHGQASINSQVKCKQCSKTTCIACFDKKSHKLKEYTVEDTKVGWCCSLGRLFVIWIMLCGFDVKFCSDKRQSAAVMDKEKDVTGKVKGTGDGGVMFGRWGMMILDPALTFSSNPVDTKKKKQVEDAERKGDTFDTFVYSFLGVLLPSPDESTGFDVSPPNAVVSMLSHSRVLSKTAELLRNDSLDDATKRKNLYRAMLKFLSNVATHGTMSRKVMFADRVVLPAKVNLLTVSFQGVPSGIHETASSLAAGLRNLNIQSEAMLNSALGAKKEFADKEGKDMLWLCRMISDLCGHLRIGDHEAQRGLTTHGIVKVPDDEIWPCHMFCHEAQKMAQSRAGRIKRLITEITTLKTSLPEGIYVKHAESRLDVMKVLIVGPEGTPYENGFFEFDLWCPHEYPIVPPNVIFRETAGGARYRINPTLLPNKKVCLSILNSWEGPKWRPGESTILQVLMSIQALVLCEKPPEMYVAARGEQGRVYNMQVRGYTVRRAILWWAKDPPALWKDQVDYHFRTNGNKILQTAEHWAREGSEEDTLSGSSQGYGENGRSITWMHVDLAEALLELREALQRYGATYVPEDIPRRRAVIWSGGRGGFESRRGAGFQFGFQSRRDGGFGTGRGGRNGNGGDGGGRQYRGGRG